MCKKFLLGAILTALVCMTACSKDGNDVAETSVTTVSENVTSAESTTASETAVSESEGTDETVVLLSKGEIESKKIRVEFSLENMDISDF